MPLHPVCDLSHILFLRIYPSSPYPQPTSHRVLFLLSFWLSGQRFRQLTRRKPILVFLPEPPREIAQFAGQEDGTAPRRHASRCLSRQQPTARLLCVPRESNGSTERMPYGNPFRCKRPVTSFPYFPVRPGNRPGPVGSRRDRRGAGSSRAQRCESRWVVQEPGCGGSGSCACNSICFTFAMWRASDRMLRPPF